MSGVDLIHDSKRGPRNDIFSAFAFGLPNGRSTSGRGVGFVVLDSDHECLCISLYIDSGSFSIYALAMP